MNNIECPRCGEASITLKDKLLAGKWFSIHCSNCNGRLAAQPIVLAIMYFILTWNILFFGYMTFHEQSIAYGIATIVGWAIIELFIYYVPLCKLRPLPEKKTDTNTA